jgi:hypothetical protein
MPLSFDTFGTLYSKGYKSTISRLKGSPITRPESSGNINLSRRSRVQLSFNIPVCRRIAPVFSILAAKRIAPVTHQDQAVSPSFRRPPWRPCRPRKTLVPHRVQTKRTAFVAAPGWAPVPRWLTTQAIRISTAPGGQTWHPFSFTGSMAQTPFLACHVRPSLYQAKQRFTSNGCFSFNMW